MSTSSCPTLTVAVSRCLDCVRRLSSAAFEATLSPLKEKPLLRHAALPQAASREREADDDDDDDDDDDADDDDDDDEPGPFCADFGIRKEQAAYSIIPLPPRFKFLMSYEMANKKPIICQSKTQMGFHRSRSNQRP